MLDESTKLLKADANSETIDGRYSNFVDDDDDYDETKLKTGANKTHYGTLRYRSRNRATGSLSAKKYYYVPYTEEERREEQGRQKKIVLSTLALCLTLVFGGLVPLIV